MKWLSRSEESPKKRPRTGTPTSEKWSWRKRLRVAAAVLGVLMLAVSPWALPRLLSQLEYFRLTKVEFEGVRFTRPAELQALLPVDSSWSVWAELDTVVKAVETHPLVASAEARRRFPGTVVVRVTERIPVALVQQQAGGGRLIPMSAEARELPMEAARIPLDLPVVFSPDSAILHTLAVLQADAPELYARIVMVRRVAADHLVFEVGGATIRTRDNVTGARFLDILPVEEDVARNGLRAVEYDLRFNNQVIVRQP